MAIGDFATAGAKGKILPLHPRFSQMLPGNMIQVAPNKWAPSFGPYMPNVGQEYFIDPQVGNDSNNGLSWSASLATPMGFFTKPNAGVGTIRDGATFSRTQWNFTNQDLNISTTLRVENRGSCKVYGSDFGIVWTAHPTLANVWVTTKTNVLAVGDYLLLDSDGMPTWYSAQTSAANVAANAGSYYWTTATGSPANTVYMRTLDGRPPNGDDTFQVIQQVSSVFRPSTPGISIGLRGIQFVGTPTVGIRALSTSIFPTLYADNCQFNFTRSTTNGFQNLGGDRFFFGCVANGNAADGFNDHINGGRLGFSFEHQCSAQFNGDPVTAVNDNGTTAHDGWTAFQNEGYYANNYGPNHAFVDFDTYVCAINCKTADSRKLNQPNNLTIGGGTSGGTKGVYIGQTSTYSGSDPTFKDFVLSSGGTGRYVPLPGTNPTFTVNGNPSNLTLCTLDNVMNF